MDHAQDAPTEDPSAKPPDAKAAVEKLAGEWRAAHEQRVGELEAELCRDSQGARADENLVFRLVAHDAVLADLLGDTQVQLAQRLAAFVDNAKVGLLLARTLEQVTTCRNAATRRAGEMLVAAGTLRSQRRIASGPHLRAVAS